MHRFSHMVLLASAVALGGFAAVGDLQGQPRSRAAAPPANTPPPQGVSRGENFSNKQPAQLFASDCTGAGCHRTPHGMAKGQGQTALAGFLREHYTNSRESAAALAAYLAGNPKDLARPDSRSRTGRNEEQAKPGDRKPADRHNPRGQRGRQATAAHPPPPPEPPPPPPKPQFDIFD